MPHITFQARSNDNSPIDFGHMVMIGHDLNKLIKFHRCYEFEGHLGSLAAEVFENAAGPHDVGTMVDYHNGVKDTSTVAVKLKATIRTAEQNTAYQQRR